MSFNITRSGARLRVELCLLPSQLLAPSSPQPFLPGSVADPRSTPQPFPVSPAAILLSPPSLSLPASPSLVPPPPPQQACAGWRPAALSSCPLLGGHRQALLGCSGQFLSAASLLLRPLPTCSLTKLHPIRSGLLPGSRRFYSLSPPGLRTCFLEVRGQQTFF